MLSYQHIYHAGNLADVQKHLWLITVLSYLTLKDKDFIWIDTHAGRGLYDLTSAEAQKIKEYETGIVPLLNHIQDMKELPTPLNQYIDIIHALNKDQDAISRYPGSAYLAAKLMRPTDKLYAYDLHKGEFPHLERAIGIYMNANPRFEDGYQGLKSLIPHKLLKRGGVLIDPSYEVKDEYAQCAKAVLNAYTKWPQGIYMVWYPILDKAYHHDLLDPLKALNLPEEDFTIDEWMFDGIERGMKGTGMVIINPPYKAAKTMQNVKNVIQ